MFFLDNLDKLKALVNEAIDAAAYDRKPLTPSIASIISALPGSNSEIIKILDLMVCGINDKNKVRDLREFIDGVTTEDYKESSVTYIEDFLESMQQIFYRDESFSKLRKYDRSYILNIFSKIDDGVLSDDMEGTKFVLLLTNLVALSHQIIDIKHLINFDVKDLPQ